MSILGCFPGDKIKLKYEYQFRKSLKESGRKSAGLSFFVHLLQYEDLKSDRRKEIDENEKVKDSKTATPLLIQQHHCRLLSRERY